jgi:hypothetical protein
MNKTTACGKLHSATALPKDIFILRYSDVGWKLPQDACLGVMVMFNSS